MIATATKQTCLLWTLCALLYPLSCTEQQFFFSLDLTCQGQVVSSRHCHITVGARSHLTCAVRCSGYQDCVYSVWDSNHGLCRLCPVVADENCTNTEKSKFRGYRNLGKACQHGGAWDPDSQRCSCPAGFAGNRCQRRIYDCSEGFRLGYPDGVYLLQPPLATSPFSAWCTMSTGGRTVITRRHSPDVIFNRTWQEFREGFGNPTSDFWMGLQPLYLLTNSGINYLFKVSLILQDGTIFQQHYVRFWVGDEASGYRLHFSETVPHPAVPLGDSLSTARGAAFSTYDADHDGDVTENCALRHQSGWWFPNPCNLTEANPLGRIRHPQDDLWSGEPEDVFWINDLGGLAPWKVRLWLTQI